MIRTDGHAVGIREGDAESLEVVNARVAKDLADGKPRSSFARWHEAQLPADMPKE